jgi:PLP dependent protein
MAAGREDGGQHQQRGAAPFGPNDLAPIVNGRNAREPTALWTCAVNRSGSTSSRARFGAAKSHEASRGNAASKRLALRSRQRIVAHDDADLARQAVQSLPERFALTLIGEQPKARQSKVAAGHHPAYSAAMSEAERLQQVRDGVARAANLARRDAADVTLIAVSKTHAAEAIEPMIRAGQTVFGENRVQEAEAKWSALQQVHPGIELHLVGQLQSNKAEASVRLFDAIHSVDRPSLVEALARATGKLARTPLLFAQVNIGDEPQKGGCPTADLPPLLTQARDAGLTISGLMCVPPAGVEAAPYFALLAKLARDHGLSLLSMGMSDDYETAVMLGATHIRVGSALFGART